MKTKTYARLSLLIPFLVWVLFLLCVLVMSSPPVNNITSTDSTSPLEWVSRFIIFYVLGIIIWLIPYLLLGGILFSLTFVLKPAILVNIFALSPFAMTILTLALIDIMVFADPRPGGLTSNPYINAQDLLSTNMFFAIFVLIAGYICVGIGYGLYKFLEHSGKIKEARTEAQPALTGSSE